MPKTDPVAVRQLARLERAAVILDRFHLELHAFAPSARTTRLLRANRHAAEALQLRMEKARLKCADAPAEARNASPTTPKPQRRLS